jgi:hypothetical protein
LNGVVEVNVYADGSVAIELELLTFADAGRLSATSFA